MTLRLEEEAKHKEEKMKEIEDKYAILQTELAKLYICQSGSETPPTG